MATINQRQQENAAVQRRATYEPILDVPAIPPGGEDSCDWDSAVCHAVPTHRIIEPCRSGEDHKHTYDLCGRHYASWLARFAVMHAVEAGCSVAPKEHVAYYGTIAGAPVNED